MIESAQNVLPLGQLLVRANIITEKQLNEALQYQKQTGKKLGHALISLGYIKEETLANFLSTQYNLPLIKLSEQEFDPFFLDILLKLVPYETALKYLIFPISMDGSVLTVATADPANKFAISGLGLLTGMKVSVYVASESEILEAIKKYYPQDVQTVPPAETETIETQKREQKELDNSFDLNILEPKDLDKLVDSVADEITVVEEKEEAVEVKIDAPMVKLVDGILLNAVKSRASDIHIEPYENVVVVRFRIDGMLQPIMKLPVKIKAALSSRIKIMSNLDISERRLPQDGRIKLKFGGTREIDFRVSTLPTLFGEKIVLRLLDKSNLQLDLVKLGFDEKPLQDFLEAIEKPYGMILVTGPTGSGKTTTLYSALSHLNKPGVNIMTAEDPVEYNFMGINQVQIREDIGLTFASALRSFLRQDPDIILVGEIRDFETAEIAVKAALTGHLVLSTLHTNDAPSTITRLINMGIEPFLVSSSVILIVAQRLARKLCQNCKREQKISEASLIKIGFPKEIVGKVKCYEGAGCPACNNTGYKGRVALYEVMPIKDELKELIIQGGTAVEIKKEAVRLGMATLRQSGIKKVIDGITTIEEILRVTFED